MVENAVLTALQKQLACYQRLAKLAQTQHEHVQNSRTEALLEVLARRQKVLDEIGELEKVIGPAKKKWGAFLGELPAEQRAWAEDLLGKTRELLEEITTADRNDAMALQNRKLNLGVKINQAGNAPQVNRKYAAAAYGSRRSALDVHQ